MAITRIRNNQIFDADIIASAKCVQNSVTTGLLEDDLVYGSNLTVSGDLIVNGTTTTISTTNTTVEDPVMVLASTQTGAGAVDIGILGERGSDTNVFMGWDESENQFIVAEVSESESHTIITPTAFAPLKVGTIETTGAATFAALTVTPGDTNVVILNSTGLASLDGGLDVGDQFSVDQANGNTNTGTGTLDVGGAATLTSTLDVTTGLTSLDGGLDVGAAFGVDAANGNVLTTGTLGAGATTVTTIDASGLAQLDGGIAVNGSFSVADGTGNISTTGTLNADGATTLGQLTIDATSVVDMGGNIVTNIGTPSAGTDAATKDYVDTAAGAGFVLTAASNTSTITTAYAVNGTTNEIELTHVANSQTLTIGLPDDVTIGNDLTVTGNTGTATLGVTGISTLATVNASGLASLDGGIDVDGAFTVADTSGDIDTTGTLSAAATDVTTLVATGLAELDGGINVNDIFTVDASGNTDLLTGTLNVDGATTLDDLTIGAGATVDLGANIVTNAGTPAAANDLTTKSYVDNLVTGGTVWRDPVIDPNLVGVSATAPVAPVTGAGWIATAAGTWGTASVVLNDYAVYTGTDWTVVENVTAGDRFIIGGEGTTIDTSLYSVGFRQHDVVQYTSGLVGTFTSWDLPHDAYYDVIHVSPAKAAGDATGFANDASTYDLDVTTDVGAGAVTAQLQITGSAAQTYGTLITAINAALDGSAQFAAGEVVATLEPEGHIHITNVTLNEQLTIAEGTAGGTAGMLATLTGFVAVYAGVQDGTTVLCNDPDSFHNGHTYSYSHDANSWTEISGPGAIDAGTNLAFTGNVLNVSPQGAGSNLDADQLDAQEGSYYLDWTNTTNKPTPLMTLSGDVSGTVTIDLDSAINMSNTVVADNSHDHTIANVTNLQTELDSKLANTGDTLDSGTLSIASGASIAVLTGGDLTIADAPVAGTDAANKDYVDGVAGTGFTIDGDTGTSNPISGGDTLTIAGTANEIETAVTVDTITVGLPDDVVITDTLGVTGLASLDGGIAVDANFTVDGGTGAVLTLSTATVGGVANLNGGIAVDGTAFTVADTSGNTAINGTLGVVGDTTLATTGVTGVLTVTGSAAIDNLTIDGNAIDATAGTEIVINELGADIDFRVEGDTDVNLIVADAGTDSVNIGTATALTDVQFQVAGTSSAIIVKGSDAQRPTVGIAGMMRYNTTVNQYEFFDGTVWATFGTEFTVIASETFAGTGAQTIYTLATAQTTASCIVSINGVVQIPSTAYGVSGTTLTFTEAPDATDVIEVRELTTTTTVATLTNGVVSLDPVAGGFEVVGDFLPATDVTYDLGSPTKQWQDLHLAGTTIYLGGSQIKNVAGVLTFQDASGDPANIDLGDSTVDGGTY